MALSTCSSQAYTLRAITRTDPKVWIKAEKDSQNALYKFTHIKLLQKLLVYNTYFTHFLSVAKHEV